MSSSTSNKTTTTTIASRYRRLHERFGVERNGQIVPVRFVGSYVDLLSIPDEQHESSGGIDDPLDLLNFDDETINTVVRRYHDLWISLLLLLFTEEKTNGGGSSDNQNSILRFNFNYEYTRRQKREIMFLLRFFENEWRLRDSDRAPQDIPRLCSKLDRLNKIMSRRLYEQYRPPFSPSHE